jgi:hypothetical protein
VTICISRLRIKLGNLRRFHPVNVRC